MTAAVAVVEKAAVVAEAKVVHFVMMVQEMAVPAAAAAVRAELEVLEAKEGDLPMVSIFSIMELVGI
jgi:hypothetical protein